MGKDAPYAAKLEKVQAVLEKLRAGGHEAWLNGGCVRDHLLGKEPADFDVATSATPDQVEAIFPRSIAVGKAFGVAQQGVGIVQVRSARVFAREPSSRRRRSLCRRPLRLHLV